jgi:hypothetical protein
MCACIVGEWFRGEQLSIPKSEHASIVAVLPAMVHGGCRSWDVPTPRPLDPAVVLFNSGCVGMCESALCNVLWSEGDVAIVGGGGSAGAGEEALGVVRPGATLFTRGLVGGIWGGGVAGVVAAAVAATTTSPVDLLFNGSMSSVTTSVSVCSARSLLCSLMCVMVGSTWGVCTVTVLFASRPA